MPTCLKHQQQQYHFIMYAASCWLQILFWCDFYLLASWVFETKYPRGKKLKKNLTETKQETELETNKVTEIELN